MQGHEPSQALALSAGHAHWPASLPPGQQGPLPPHAGCLLAQQSPLAVRLVPLLGARVLQLASRKAWEAKALRQWACAGGGRQEPWAVCMDPRHSRMFPFLPHPHLEGTLGATTGFLLARLAVLLGCCFVGKASGSSALSLSSVASSISRSCASHAKYLVVETSKISFPARIHKHLCILCILAGIHDL
jgi:hypothetical protein